MKATIERHGRFSYRWTAGHVRGYALTYYGAVRAAKKQAKSVRKWMQAKENAEILEV